MGNISSTTCSLKRNTPDLTPVQNLCQSFYSHTRAAVSKIDVHKLNQLLPDQEARSRLAKNAIDIALEEGSKSVPVTGSLKSGIADLITPVKNACQSSYGNVCATVSKIDHAVGVDAVKILNQYLPDQEARLQFAINLAKNIFDIVFYKYVPGGVRLYRIASKSLGDVKKFEDPKKDVKALKLRVDKMEQEISMCRKELEQVQAEMHKQA